METSNPYAPALETLLVMFDKTRTDLLKLLEGLSPEQMYHMPAGFRNNLLWNLGHVVVTQQALFYEQSGLPLLIPPHYLEMFRKGTHPGQWTMAVNPDEVKAWLRETSRRLRDDMSAGVFKSFAPYQTSWGCRLANLPDILAFTAWHESLHFGIMSSMRKLV